MNILADESVDRRIVERLRMTGHEVQSVAEMTPGVDDEEVLSAARSNHAILLTSDKDFGELVFRLGRATDGVVLLRLSGLSSEHKADIVVDAVKKHKADFRRGFAVITSTLVRVRRTLTRVPGLGETTIEESGTTN